MEATGFGTEVHPLVDSSHGNKKNNNKNENITSNDKKNNNSIDAEDRNQTMEVMTMVVVAVVNDGNSQEQETITSCDHDVALTEHL